MQRSLPLANQPRDPLTGKRAEHYLSGVPIGLLPLLAASDDSPSTSEAINTPSPVASPRPSSPTFPSINCDTVECAPVSGWNMNFHRTSTHAPLPASSTYKAPPHLVHLLPSRLRPNRQKPRFSFLPLLDTPSSSESSSPFPSNAPSRTPSPSHDGDLASDTDQSFDPPTPSLTNASLDSSPYSRASSCSPEPPFLQLPSPPNTKPNASQGGGGGGYVIGSNDSYFPPCDLFNNIPDIPSRFHQIAPRDHSRAAMTRPQAMPHPMTLTPPSPLTLPPVKAKKRNIIVVNDVEIELDDEDEEPQVTIENTTGAIFPSNDIDERTATPTIEDVALSETKKANLIDDVRSDNLATGVSSSVPPPPLKTPTLSSSSFKPPSSAGMVFVSPPRYPGSHRSKIHGSYHYPSPSLALPSSPTLDLSSPSSTMNESVNLHIPIFFKRGIQSTSYAVNRSH